MAGNPTVHDDAYAGSPNITPGNMFNSPDGMAFDQNGLVWIQTDGDESNEGDFAGMGNNQMLVGDPVTGEIARFLNGPSGCEVTGLTWSETGARCSSGFSTRAATGPTAARCRARPSSPSSATTTASSAETACAGGAGPPPWRGPLFSGTAPDVSAARPGRYAAAQRAGPGCMAVMPAG